MIDLGPHAAFIWLSYGAAVVVVAGLMIWAFTGEARNRARLEALERRGFVRRAHSSNDDGASQQPERP